MTEKKTAADAPLEKKRVARPVAKAAQKAAIKVAKKAAPKAAVKTPGAEKAVAKTAKKAIQKGPARRKLKSGDAAAAEAPVAPVETARPDPSKILADIAHAALEDLKAVDIKVLDVSKLTTITDIMLIATGTSNRHAASLAHGVIDKVKENGHRPVGVEGLNEGEWVLVNLGGVIVHVMQAQARAFYQLEKLWDFTQREAPARNAHA